MSQLRQNCVNYYRTGWISDVHLGTKGSNAAILLDFLRENDFETLYIVGDLIDIWSLRRGIYWPQQHNDVIQKNPAQGAQGHSRNLYSRKSRRASNQLLGCLWEHRHQGERHSCDGLWRTHFNHSWTRTGRGGAKCEVAGIRR